MNMEGETICGYYVSPEKKKVNAVYLDLLAEFEELCRRAGLTWWLYAGALLGAARHKGFIPWDDDVDLLMPRADFDRLQAMTNEEFGTREPYFLQNFATDPSCIQALIRFRRSDTSDIRDYDLTWKDANPEKPPYNMGISLAVFPLDAVPAGNLARRFQTRGAYTLWGIFYRATRPDPAKPMQHRICLAILRLLGGQNLMKLQHRLYRAPRRVRPGYVQSYDGLYPDCTLAWPLSDFDGTVRLPFEDVTVPAPAGWDDILRTIYGDYMQFPPAEERVETHSSGHTDADTPYLRLLAELRP